VLAMKASTSAPVIGEMSILCLLRFGGELRVLMVAESAARSAARRAAGVPGGAA